MSERRAVLRNEAAKETSQGIVSQATYYAFLPVVDALAGVFTPSLFDKMGWLPITIMWLVLVIFHVVFWWRTKPAPHSLLKLIVESEDRESEIYQLKQTIHGLGQAIELSSALATLNYTTRRMVVKYVQNGISTKDHLYESLSEIMAPLHLEGEHFFGIQGSERWNFAVYLFSAKEDQLVPIWREKARNHPSEGAGRSWGRGEGHVGKAWVNGKAIITGDASHPEVAPLSAAPHEKERDYDVGLYRSYASIPIGPLLEDEGFPYGVLVATSDRIGRFDKENTAILVHIADSIASLLSLSGANLDTLVSLTTAPPGVPNAGTR
jgi:hypothetical protein